MVGRNDHLSHSLVPLSVAVVLVRQSIYGSRRSAESPDPNAEELMRRLSKRNAARSLAQDDSALSC